MTRQSRTFAAILVLALTACDLGKHHVNTTGAVACRRGYLIHEQQTEQA